MKKHEEAAIGAQRIGRIPAKSRDGAVTSGNHVGRSRGLQPSIFTPQPRRGQQRVAPKAVGVQEEHALERRGSEQRVRHRSELAIRRMPCPPPRMIAAAAFQPVVQARRVVHTAELQVHVVGKERGERRGHV